MLLLWVTVWLLSLTYHVTGNHTALTVTAYWITESAGTYGTLILIACAGYCYSLRYNSLKEKIVTFLRSVVVMLLFVAVFAFVNEHMIKPVMAAVRPSHRFLLTKTGNLNLLDSVYSLSKEDRRLFFTKLVADNQQRFTEIDVNILQHWIMEAGYSFPSGHSFNAFMLATLFAFSLKKARKEKYHRYYALPFIWAILVALSRVIIGAHAPLDVGAGAAMGLTVAGIFLFLDSTRWRIIHHHKPN